MKYISLQDLKFAPNADYTKPDVLVSLSDMSPSSRGGYKPAYALSATGYAAFVGCLGSSVLKRSDGSIGVYAGNLTKLAEADGVNAWTDRSKGGGYTNTATSWQFAAYGTTTLATNNVDNPQFATGAGATFADLTGAPKAKCIAVLNNVVMLFNYDAGGGRIGDGWFGSDAGDFTNWTATAANAVANGRLTDTPGPINACATMNDTVIAWKSRGMYIGRFVGGDTEWSWQLLSPDVGCVAPDAWVHTDAGIVFVSERDVFLYDGGSLRAIAGADIRGLIYAAASADNLAFVKCTYEPVEGLVYIFVNVSGSSNGCDRAFTWSHLSSRWGLTGSAGFFGNVTFSFVLAVMRNPNYADLKSRGFATNSTRCAATVFDKDGKSVCFSGTNALSPSIQGPMIGKSERLSTLLRITPLFFTPPTGTDTLALSYGQNAIAVLDQSGGVFTWDPVANRFDGEVQGKYFQFTHGTMGEVFGYQLGYQDGPEE